MNSLLIRNIFTNKRTALLLVYVLIMSCCFVCFNDYSIVDAVHKTNFNCFLIVPVSLILSIIVLNDLSKNIEIQQRFTKKREYATQIIKILIVSFLVITMFILFFLLFFGKFKIDNINSLLLIFIKIFTDLLLYSSIIELLSVTISKNLTIVITIIYIAIMFVFNINILNDITILSISLKLFIAFISYYLFNKLYYLKMFEGVMK